LEDEKDRITPEDFSEINKESDMDMLEDGQTSPDGKSKTINI